MTKRARPLRKLLLAAAVATTMLVTGCASNPAGSNGSAAASGSTHTGHDTSPAAPALPLRAGERFVNLTMPEPYTPTAPQGGTDEYRCLILDPNLTTPAFPSPSTHTSRGKKVAAPACLLLRAPHLSRDEQRRRRMCPGRLLH